MPIFDFRLRPPTGSFLDGALYGGLVSEMFSSQVEFETASSVKNKSMDLLFQEMDAAEVKKGLVLGRVSNIYGTIGAEEIAAVVNTNPNRFVGAAALDLVDWKGAIKVIKKAMKNGLKAVNFEPGFCDLPMYSDDRRLYPIYAYCEEKNIPVVIMGGGLAGPDVSYTAPQCIDRVCGDFPGMKVAVSHGGWPWVHEALQVAWRHQNLYLSPDVYLCGFPGCDEFIKAADGFLARRTLYGSAYPICPVKEYAEWFQTLSIRPENMERVLWGNAIEFLGLDE